MARVSVLVAAATVAAACALVASPGGRAGSACGVAGYSYAGVLGSGSRSGVTAVIEALDAPTVRGGHVAAWVGVGGEGLGPTGTDEWLQAGISAEPAKGMALYYELALPGTAPRYVMLKGHLTPGRSYRVSVLEPQGHPGWWEVRVNGARVTGRIRLPGSHGAWRPVATTESWDGGFGACNSFRFRFSGVSAAARPGGAWSPLDASVIDAPGFRVTRLEPGGFVALGGTAA
jgi:hypothetical protein